MIQAQVAASLGTYNGEGSCARGTTVCGMVQPLELPNGDWFDAVTELTALGVETANRRGWLCLVERSDRSEATYLHVERVTAWYGYRIASHEPFYECSATYQQILVPQLVNKESLKHYARFLEESIRRAGKVVANPLDVQKAIFAEEDARAVKLEAEGRAAAIRKLAAAKPPRYLGKQAAERPEAKRRPRLSASECSRIRRRLNSLAQWIFDESAKL